MFCFGALCLWGSSRAKRCLRKLGPFVRSALLFLTQSQAPKASELNRFAVDGCERDTAQWGLRESARAKSLTSGRRRVLL